MTSGRPSVEKYFMQMAELVATRGTCARRLVGCVLTNSRNHVLATGYNGVASGMVHCRDNFLSICSGKNAPSGTALDMCQAIHAEQNALLQCRDCWDIHACYTTTSPCITCVKLLMNTSCRYIVFRDEYPHVDAKKLWIESSMERRWIHLA